MDNFPPLLSWLLYLLGLCFLGCEIFVPGGVIGVVGFFLVLAGIGLSTYESAYLAAILMMVVTIVVIPTLFFYALRRVSLHNELSRDHGFTEGQENLDLLGHVGHTLSPLRPSGTAEFEGRRYSVVSESDLIDADERVTIIKVEGNRIFVRRVDT
ncbi:MAG: NfeD family protein [Planctomycetes bacterium]|nr:NfeD family protein [Planctomycetota bacterium]